MTLSPEVQDGIKTYLWEVASYLFATDAETRAEILRDVESHIHEALAVRSAAPAPDDLQAVLAEMPPPASYAPERETVRWPSDNRRLTWNEVPGALVEAGRRFIDWLRGFVWESVVGIILLVVGLPLLLRGYVLMRFGASYNSAAATSGAPGLFFRSSSETFIVIGVMMLSLGIIALLLACGIGGVGIQRIRNSDWRLQGFTGAFIAYIVPQVLLITFLISIFFLAFFGEHGSIAAAPIIVTMITSLVIAGALDYFLIKYRWIALHQGAPEQVAGPTT